MGIEVQEKMVDCQICKEKEAEQEHHVSYYPVLKIDICIDCHKLIHKHSVGSPGSPVYEVISDSPFGIHLPLISAELRLTYECKHCGEPVYIRQSLINLLLFRKPLAEPREKCLTCKNKLNHGLRLDNSWITTSDFILEISPKKKEES